MSIFQEVNSSILLLPLTNLKVTRDLSNVCKLLPISRARLILWSGECWLDKYTYQGCLDRLSLREAPCLLGILLNMLFSKHALSCLKEEEGGWECVRVVWQVLEKYICFRRNLLAMVSVLGYRDSRSGMSNNCGTNRDILEHRSRAWLAFTIQFHVPNIIS